VRGCVGRSRAVAVWDTPFLQCNSYAFCLHSFYLAQGLE
jgi:hypothetical protein